MSTPIVPGLVSTIIPAFNRAAMLREAVNSVMAQTWPQIEILICDDGSTDDTVALGQQLAADDERITYLWNPNRGAGAAREAGRQQARGEFIQYLDSDDTLWPRKFERQIAALRAQPHCGAAYGWIRLCPEDGLPATSAHKWTGRSIPTLFPHLLVDRWWNTDVPLWRRSVTDRIGPWSTLRYSQDWEYDARAGALGIMLAHVPEFVSDQRHHGMARQTGHGRWLEPADRVRFFQSLAASARQAGVAREASEWRHFSRWMFSQARMCAQLGDPAAAQSLLRLSISAAAGPALDQRLFGLLAKGLGWQRLVDWSEAARGALRKRPGPHTLKQSWMQSADE